MPDLLRSSSLTSFAETARGLGLDPLRLLDACGIDPRCLDEPERRLATTSFVRLLELASRAADVEDFGLRMAERRTPAVLGPLGLLVREEASVRDLLGSLLLYLRVHAEGVRFPLEERHDQAVIRTELRLERAIAARQGVELVTGFLYRLLRTLLGPQWRPMVCFAHAAPRRRDRHNRLFAGRVRFDQQFSGIVCAARDLDRPLAGGDAKLAAYARQHLDTLLDEAGDTLAARVRKLAELQLASGQFTAERAAQQLDIDRRTLSRRLAAERRTFSEIVDEVRGEILTSALASDRRPLSDLAEAAGFSSLSAFSRWFRGRYRMAPSAWRRATLSGASATSSRQRTAGPAGNLLPRPRRDRGRR